MSKEKSEMNVLQLSSLINEFHSTVEFEKAVFRIFSEICRIFNIDKLSLINHHENLNKYFKMFEFNKTGLIDYSNQLNITIDECINTLYYAIDDNMKDFNDLCNNQNYIHTDDYLKIQPILNNVGFQATNPSDINEIYVFSNVQKSFFAYCVFEKHDDKTFSDRDIKMITSLCKLANSKIREMIMHKTYETSLLMKETVLSYEEVPIAVVEKDTFKILYHNEFYYKVFPSIEIGGICYELMGNDEKCEECCIDKDVLIKNEWIKKGIPFTMSNGKIAYLIYAKDNTDYLKELKAVDKLTRTLLFRGFEDYYMNFVQRNNDLYALCSLDIDKFKYINHEFGYDLGDEVLKSVANVIRKFIKNHENFCRVSEDKFSIFLHYNDENELHSKISMLSNLFIEMKNEHFQDTRITVIGGVTLVDKNLDIQTLLDQSITAKLVGKGSHKNKFSYYDPKIDIKVKEDLQIEEMIPFALANDEFHAYLQPKFNLKTRKICGAEVLVRWVTPKGMIFPDKFIPLFEKNGFILTLDFIMYEKVMQFIRTCLDKNLPVYPISVNVSRNHIKDKHFLNKFIALLEKYDIPHEYLELEITESVFVEDKQLLKTFINEIKEQDLKISIDDFGTAYSSLQTLTDINVDILKIDKGFLDNIVLDEDDTATKDEILFKNIILIKSIINLAKELEFKVICEGVETDGQIELLKNIGCELGQGYAFAKPMPIADYTSKYIL